MVLQKEAENAIDGACEHRKNFKENENKKTILLSIRKLKFMGLIIRKEVLENLILTVYIESKRSRRRQRVTYPTNLCTCLTEYELGRIGKEAHIARIFKG